MIVQERVVGVMDEEWLELICEAKMLGLSIEEVQTFLNQKEQKDNS
ncbi:DNA-binding anti-repressor SinI [Neobacillus kokaensis]|uniref:Sin domain-containing protein n=1 Tax=Neobacillus kokaensis TaxID=2759023 RepID=A0ABQ3N8D2_9BACI|nr:DNA-binding anti-repressor SinI [Neobacillus kokaensis]GHI00274.1 hypothetical protein AM1BK_38160 [Neobacillus kokaensis]